MFILKLVTSEQNDNLILGSENKLLDNKIFFEMLPKITYSKRNFCLGNFFFNFRNSVVLEILDDKNTHTYIYLTKHRLYI